MMENARHDNKIATVRVFWAVTISEYISGLELMAENGN